MHHYQKLEVWKRAIDFAERSYVVTENFPSEEKFSIVNQMRRSAISIPSNIAEGAGRNSKKEFSQFLAIALGSLFELETQYILSGRLKYIEDTELKDCIKELQSIGKMIFSLKKSLG